MAVLTNRMDIHDEKKSSSISITDIDPQIKNIAKKLEQTNTIGFNP